MTNQRTERTALHIHPSAIDALAADYPHWEVSRDRTGATHGDWHACRGDVTLSAPTPAGLLVRLETQELARLQDEHGEQWKVWRSKGGSWVATSRTDDVEQTLMEDTPGALEKRMRNPDPWGNQRLLRGEL